MTDLGQSFVVEIDPNMELENVMALLEAEVCCWDLATQTPDLELRDDNSLASRSQNKAFLTLGEISVIRKQQ